MTPLSTLFLGSDNNVLALLHPPEAASFLMSPYDGKENHPGVFLGVRARSRYSLSVLGAVCAFSDSVEWNLDFKPV